MSSWKSASEPAADQKLRVLVVDDDDSYRSFIVVALGILGHYPTEVSNGAEAIQAVGDSDYDVILMDCIMPGINGFDATRHIRKLNEWAERHTRILGMTTIELRDTCIDAGMDAFIGKPTTPAELASALEPYLKR